MANEIRLISNSSGIAVDLAAIDNSYATSIVYDDDVRTGGNVFIWNLTGTANDGTVYAGLTGFWKMQFNGAINVQWFGAIGNGTGDDSIAINNALIVGKGGEVYIPQGHYVIADGSIQIPSYTSLIGDGSDLTLITPLDTVQYNTITNLADTGRSYGTRGVSEAISLKGLKVDNFAINSSGLDSTLAGRCAEFEGVDGLVIEECIFTNGYSDNVRLYLCTNYLFQKNEVSFSRGLASGVTANGLTIVDIGTGTTPDIRDMPGGLITGNCAISNAVAGLVSSAAANVIFTSNTIKYILPLGGSMSTGIALEGNAYGCKIIDNVVVNCFNGYKITNCTSSIFTGNTAYNCASVGLVGSDTSSTLISNNIFDSCGSAISFKATTIAGGMYYNLNENISIINNEINYPASPLTTDAIYLENGYNAIISSNRVIGAGKNGVCIIAKTPATNSLTNTLNITVNLNTILASGCNGILVKYAASVYITGNIVKNNGYAVENQAGVYLTSSQNCIIADNDLSRDQTTATQGYGYHLDACTNISINNNNVAGNQLISTPGNDVLPIIDGGTGLSAVGTAGQLLRSNGSTLEYFTPAYGWLYNGYSSNKPILPGNQNKVIRVYSTNTGFTMTLEPDSTTTSGTNVIFKNNGASPLTVTANAVVTIEGAVNTYVLQPGSMFWIIATAANVWQIVYYSEEIGNVGVTHLIGKSAAVTYASGTGLGTGGVLSVSGTDLSGTISFTTGTSPVASARIARITFKRTYANVPHVVIGASGANTANFYVNNKTTTYFDIYIDSAALIASTAYAIDYLVAQ